MILIVYYKQITEGYEDRERYRIMRKVGLSRREIRRSISSQILIVFFLPLAAAGLHVAFAFPGIVTMFRALSMTNVTLIAGCALAALRASQRSMALCTCSRPACTTASSANEVMEMIKAVSPMRQRLADGLFWTGFGLCCLLLCRYACCFGLFAASLPRVDWCSLRLKSA